MFPDETKYMETLVLSAWTSFLFTTVAVEGNVIDALSGQSVKDAVIKLRKGWNRTSGGYCTNIFGQAKSTKTSSNGHFSISMSAGAYTVEITKSGYITGYYNVVASGSALSLSLAQTTMVLTPVLDSDEYRIVLTWGASPSDLDSHLTYYQGSTQKEHVYFHHNNGSINGNADISLDLDDMSSYGPETITLKLDPSYFEENGKFSYSVHDYSNKSSSISKSMSLSNATVSVYAGNTLMRTFHIPKDNVGTVWHVFDIVDEGTSGLRFVNSFYNCSAAANVN